MRGKVTKRSVEAIKPRTSDVFLWDTELRGFGVRVVPSGVVSFVVSYYAPNLHLVRRRITLGSHPPLSPDEARALASETLAAVAKGADPAKDRTAARIAAREETVARLFANYLEHGKAHFKSSTLEGFESLGRLHIIPALGTLPVAQVRVKDVAQLHYSLRDRPGAANRVGSLLRAFFNWLERRELFSGKNPAKNLDWYTEHPRERFLTIAEVTSLGQALHMAETTGLPVAPEHRREGAPLEMGPARPVAVAAIRFLMLTGWRESEALTLRWSEVNLARGYVTLPDSKTGKSIRTLPAPAVELLESVPRGKSPWVFPGRNPIKPLEGVRRTWYAARAYAELSGLRLHDLRHSVASFAADRGYSLFLIGKLLGHKSARSTERYAHLTDDARKLMADDVGEAIRDAMNPSKSD